MKNEQLYRNIAAFDIDGGPAAQSFEMRLATENGWALPYAQRVIVEYKRFVFLTMTAGHPCSPSAPVDEAWHLHLIYTESYWDRFTTQVLPRPLHHNPTKGGASENAKHVDYFTRTLESYEAAFGESPPADIWLTTEPPKLVDLDWRQVNVRQNWVVPKGHIRLAACAVAALIVIAGCMPALAQASDDAPFPTGLVIGGVVLVVGGLGLILLIKYLASRSTPGSGVGGNCSGDGCNSGCSGAGYSGAALVVEGAVAAAVDVAEVVDNSPGPIIDSGGSSCSAGSCSSSSCNS